MILEASVQYLRFPGDNDKEDTESNCLSQFARKQKQNPWVSEERMTEKEEREKEEKMRTRYRPSRAWFARFSDLEKLNWVFLKVLSPLNSSMLGTNSLSWDIYESTSHQSVFCPPFSFTFLFIYDLQHKVHEERNFAFVIHWHVCNTGE